MLIFLHNDKNVQNHLLEEDTHFLKFVTTIWETKNANKNCDLLDISKLFSFVFMFLPASPKMSERSPMSSNCRQVPLCVCVVDKMVTHTLEVPQKTH